MKFDLGNMVRITGYYVHDEWFPASSLELVKEGTLIVSKSDVNNRLDTVEKLLDILESSNVNKGSWVYSNEYKESMLKISDWVVIIGNPCNVENPSDIGIIARIENIVSTNTPYRYSVRGWWYYANALRKITNHEIVRRLNR